MSRDNALAIATESPVCPANTPKVLPKTAIILAAGCGRRLNLPDKLPKSLVDIGGRTLLAWQIDAFASVGVKRIALVVGYEKARVIAHAERLAAIYGIEITFVENPHFAETNTLHSLYLARHLMDGAFYIANGDLLLRPSLVQALAQSRQDTAFAIDPHRCGDEEVKVMVGSDGRIRRIGKELEPASSLGESVGVAKIGTVEGSALAEALRYGVETLQRSDAYYEFAFDTIAGQVQLHCEVLRDEPVVEIDFPEDLHTARTEVISCIAVQRIAGIQDSIWRDHILLPGSHTLRMAAQVAGVLDHNALHRACACVMERHPLLRQAFIDFGARRRVPAHFALLPEVIDADGLDETALRALMAEKSARDFDLQHEPLVRVSAYTRGEDGYVVQMQLHHLVYDLSSALLYLEDLFTALSGAEPAAAPGGDYDLFVHREAERLQALEAKDAGQLWRNRLDGAQPVLPLGTQTSSNAVALMEGVSRTVERETIDRLKARRVPLHIACLSAYASALNMLFGIDDLLLGTTVTLRMERKLRDLDGPVFNYVPLRLQPRRGETPGDALARTAAMWRAIWPLRWYPFARILDQFEGPPAANFGLTQNFNYYDADRLGQSRIGRMRAGIPATYGDLTMRNFPLNDDAVLRPYLMNMSAMAAQGYVGLGLKYRVGLIERATAEKLMEVTAANMRALAAAL